MAISAPNPRASLTPQAVHRESDGLSALLDRLLTPAKAAETYRTAATWGSPHHLVAIACGHLTAAAWADAVAAHLGLTRPPPGIEVFEPDGDARSATVHGRPVLALNSHASNLAFLSAACAHGAAGGVPVVVATPSELEAALTPQARRLRLDSATHALSYLRPDLSASHGASRGQRAFAAAAAGLARACLLWEPGLVVAAVAALTGLAFAAVALVRLAAVAPTRRGPEAPQIPDRLLATYAVLVPLYDEPEVAADLIAVLSALDYPLSKLDIVLIVEADDAATQAALDAIAMPPHMRLLVVPEGSPRTKPRALCYALATVTADYVVVFDAKDRPEADQLRRAQALFAMQGRKLACVQARLNIYNARQSLVARQFAIEYSALFDTLLPTLSRLGWPVPLGGTSNHFPRAALIACGSWDPFNVTEDADVGIRLARLGYATAILESTTWEEAPVEPRQWLGQRTRWLKGWMRTYMVHMRRPWRTLRELGAWQWIGFQLHFGGLIASALLHPWCHALLIADAAVPGLLLPRNGNGLDWLWWVAAANLLLGYLGAVAITAAAGHRRHRLGADACWCRRIGSQSLWRPIGLFTSC